MAVLPMRLQQHAMQLLISMSSNPAYHSQANMVSCCLQTAAVVACRQLGFQGGAGQVVVPGETTASPPPNGTLLPPWLGDLSCSEVVNTVQECRTLSFGETGDCNVQRRLRLVCNNGSTGATTYCACRILALSWGALSNCWQKVDEGERVHVAYSVAGTQSECVNIHINMSARLFRTAS